MKLLWEHPNSCVELGHDSKPQGDLPKDFVYSDEINAAVSQKLHHCGRAGS